MREAVADDLDSLHLIFGSNPDFLKLREDIAEGGYDLASVKRYWELAMLDAARHLLVVIEKETGANVGLLDFVDESPADGRPWIGLVLIHHSLQRRGLGAEAVMAIAAHLGSLGHKTLRMAVIERNESGLAFADSVGFEIRKTIKAPTSPTEQAVLLELQLPEPSPY